MKLFIKIIKNCNKIVLFSKLLCKQLRPMTYQDTVHNKWQIVSIAYIIYQIIDINIDKSKLLNMFNLSDIIVKIYTIILDTYLAL